MKRSIFKSFGLLVLSLALMPLLTACVAFNLFEKADVGPTTLSGTSWVLSSFMSSATSSEATLPGSEVTLSFDIGGQINGFAGCNAFFGTYSITESRLNIGNINVEQDLRSDCSEAWVEQETLFIASLDQASGFSLRGNTLDLSFGTGQTLHFVQPSDITADPLSSSAWDLTGFYIPALGTFGLMDKTHISIRFTTDGSLSGFAGCNSYAGNYDIDGEMITFSNITITSIDKPCDPNVGYQEMDFLDALNQSKVFLIDGMTLSIEHIGGDELKFSLQEN
jgi:heat shock protein HslJ